MSSQNAFLRGARTRAHVLVLALLLFSTWPIGPALAAPTAQPANAGPTPTFSDLIYGAYLGGRSYESYPSVGVDAGGNAYVAASTYSKDFPGFLYGSQSSEMVTVASISPDGRRLNYVGTISGGLGTQRAQAIAVTPDGTAYIAGVTNATDFPVTPNNGGSACGRGYDVFLLILKPSGELRYSGCWGGTGWDQPLDIALGPDGDVVISGYTFSPDFPTTPAAFEPAYVESYDAFVLRLRREEVAPARSAASVIKRPGTPAEPISTPQASTEEPTTGPVSAGEKWRVAAATYLGGWGDDRAYDVEVGADGSVLVSGQAGDGFPVTPGAFQTTRFATLNTDAFVAHLAPDLSTARFSTFLGGPATDYAKAATFGPEGIVVTGLAKSELSISEGAYDTAGDAIDGDVFVAELDPTGSRLLRATYVGRTGQDEPTGLLVDDTGVVTLSGVSQYAFPTTPGSFDPTYNGASETWFCRLDPTLSALTYSTLVGGSGFDGLRSFQGNTLRASLARLPGDASRPGRFSPDDSFYLATITFSWDWPISGTAFQSKLNYQWDLGIVRMRLGELLPVYADTPVEIDGVLTGWRGKPGLVLNSRNAGAMTLRPPSGNAAPVPPSLGDASGRLQLQWNADALYVGVTIADNDVLAPVGFPIDPGTELHGSDQIRLTLETRGVKRTFIYPSASTAANAALARTPNGWALEAAVPAESLGLPAHGLVPGETLVIEWTIVDEDAGLAPQSLTVATTVKLSPR